MAFTSSLKDEIFRDHFGNKTLYLALFKGNPTTSSNEVNASDYSRKAIKFGTPATSGNTTSIQNTEEVEFDYAESDWGNITHVAVYTTASGSKMLDHAQLNSSTRIEEDTMFWIDTGGYKIEW